MSKIEKAIILGSSSPRRKEILSLFDFPFTIDGANIDESQIDTNLSVEEYTKTLAIKKGLALAKKHPNCIIITADTIVYHEEKFLGKPKDLMHARAMLQSMSGKSHIVGTAIALYEGGNIDAEFASAKVTIRDLSEEQIGYYLKTFHPLDKAGAYGIQDAAGLLIQKIEGNFHNVVGFEVKLLEKLFAKVGINLWHHLTKKSL